MKLAEYQSLWKQLRTQADIDRLAANTSYDKDLLLVIYSQKKVQSATKKYHMIKHLASKYHAQWKAGSSFLEIANKINFPPVLTGLLIMKEEGYSRKAYRKLLNNLEEVEDKRLKLELTEVVEDDIVYSPKGNEIQAERGRRGEEMLDKWLTDNNFKFKTEKEMANEYKKTPDFLMLSPLNVRGLNVHWIESKATLGTHKEIKKNLKNQLIPYRDLYGSGMVIYWFGFISPNPMVEGILIESGNFIKNWKE
jgi:hypothetical protein